MASFLRRKSKQQVNSPQKPPIAASPPASTPLFAKFATAPTNDVPATTSRIVSGPMVLSSNARRENSISGGRYAASSVSVASSGRHNKPNALGPPSSFPTPAMDKPLPMNPQASPPAPDPSPSRRALSNRIVPLKQQPRTRTSIYVPDNKPLPVPRPTGSPVITNLMDDEFELTPTPTPGSSSHSTFAAQQQARPNGTNGASSRASYVTDLPPEFALFQEFSNGTDLDVSSRTGPVPAHKLPKQHQRAASRGARSSPPEGGKPVTSAITSISPTTTNTPPNPTLHSSPSQPPNMGNNISALHGPAASLYPSAVGSFQGSRPFIAPASSASVPPVTIVHTKQSFRRSMHSGSPPPPPGAAQPAVSLSPRGESGPSFTDVNIPVTAPRSVYQPAVAPAPVPAPILRGKPRIFAAMNAVDDNTEEKLPTPTQLSPHNLSQPLHQPYPRQQTIPHQPPYMPNGQPPPPFMGTQPPPHDMPRQNFSPYINGHQPVDEFRTPRVTDSRPLPPPSPPRVPVPVPQPPPPHTNGAVPQSPHRPKKLSKVRQPSDVTTMLPNGSSTSIMSASVESLHSNGHGHGKVHQHNGHRTLAKATPIPLRPSSSNGHKRSLSRSPTKQEQQQQQHQSVEEPPTQVDEETIRKAGIPLDDDPFAKAEGVRMLPVSSPTKENSVRRHKSKDKASDHAKSVTGDEASTTTSVTKGEDQGNQWMDPSLGPMNTQTSEERRRERRERRAREKELRKAKEREEAAAAAAAAAQTGDPDAGSEHVPTTARDSEFQMEGDFEPVEEPKEERFFPLVDFVAAPSLLGNLLSFLSFYDWCILSSVSREVRILLVQSKPLREEVLERFLKTVGYSRWNWEGKEPLSLSLQDLADYMRGVSTPSHEYARVAKMYVHSLSVHPNVRDPSLEHTVRCLTASARAYTRVVLRLRAQAEKEASLVASTKPQRAASVPPGPPPPPSSAGLAKAANGYGNGYMNGYGGTSRSMSRPSSRAPSPTMSTYSHSYASSQYGHGNQSVMSHGTMNHTSSQTSLTFRSPLFRLRRAPLLRVFVPSPEGDWLSDKSVLDCEAECKKAGVLHLMRMGDVVWDIAVGDEGNVGRLVYEGKYLIDLDYTYNPIGDLPKYVPTLAFPPSYFHRVIRTGAVTSNPIAHVDITPWGEEIAANLQLLQDRVKTETPQGAYHNVVRWVHRSSFVIRPPARVMQRGPSVNSRGQPHTPRIPIPDTDNLFIDSGWYGTIVVETEGTNEALADLQDRCGPRAFPPRPKPVNPAMAKAREENRKVFRILREKSRPGEIWIKAVSIKERLL